MKFNFILSLILTFGVFSFSEVAAKKELFIKESLNTEHNNVGIQPGEVCDVIYNPEHHHHNKCMVICGEDKAHPREFKTVGKVIGSATGTPGWLEYKNYIGSKILEGHTRHGEDMGQLRRIILCDGPCEKKSGEHEEHKMKVVAE